MNRLLLVIFFTITTSLGLYPSLLANPLREMVAGCNFSGRTYKSYRSNSPTICASDCAADPKCRAANFVSGWGRCLLLEKSGAKTKIGIQAGQRNPENKVDLEPMNTDSTGKDLRRISKILSAEKCLELCESENECLSFSYISGYQDCWFKSTAGKITTKEFFCWQKT